jgi:hypothetical protein
MPPSTKVVPVNWTVHARAGVIANTNATTRAMEANIERCRAQRKSSSARTMTLYTGAPTEKRGKKTQGDYGTLRLLLVTLAPQEPRRAKLDRKEIYRNR